MAGSLCRVAVQVRPIASGQYEGHGLAKLHFNCAIEHRQKGDDDRAIADFSEAIRLDPKRAAFYNRGNAYGAGPDFGRALWDYYKAYAPGREGRS